MQCTTTNLPLSNGIKIVSVLQCLQGKIGRTISDIQKRDERTDKPTNKKLNSVSFLGDHLHNSSEVDEMGDRLVTIGMGRKWGGAGVRAGSPMAPHVTQCDLDRGLPLYQVAHRLLRCLPTGTAHLPQAQPTSLGPSRRLNPMALDLGAFGTSADLLTSSPPFPHTFPPMSAAKAARSESSRGGHGHGSERARERNGQGPKAPGSESARVLLADSLLGANWSGSEKARYRCLCIITCFECLFCWLMVMV